MLYKYFFAISIRLGVRLSIKVIMLCQYKDALGKPREGVHQYRLFNFAIVDIIMTIIAGIVISKFFNINVFLAVLLMFLIGVAAHLLFCVDTALNQMLFK